jgi:hypothetical protein
LYNGFLAQLGAALSELAARGVAYLDRAAPAETEVGWAMSTSASWRASHWPKSFAVVRGRLGDDVGKAVAGYAKDLWPDTAETLAAKAAQASDPLAGEVLCAYAEATRELASGTRIALAFDHGQRLSEDDRDCWATSRSKLFRVFTSRVAFSTDTADRALAVTRLRAEADGVDVLEVPPLDDKAVIDWLIAEGLSDSLAGDLTRQTGGYPLLIEARSPHLQAGGALEDMPRHEQLATRTRASWQELSPLAASVARKAGRSPRIRFPRRSSATRRRHGRWNMATITDELRRARILSADVDGQPWFHAERRAFVLRECLTSAQRDEPLPLPRNTCGQRRHINRSGHGAPLHASRELSPS